MSFAHVTKRDLCVLALPAQHSSNTTSKNTSPNHLGVAISTPKRQATALAGPPAPFQDLGGLLQAVPAPPS